MKFNVPNHKAIEKLLTYPAGKLRVVIDTDAYNEVDDQFAIAWALKSTERMDVEAVYAAPFCNAFMFESTGMSVEQLKKMVHYAATPADGMRQSYDEIKKLYRLMKMDPEGKVFRGSEQYIGQSGRPVESEAARDLVKRAMEGDTPLYVLAIGAITNVASAILMEPKIVEKMVVVWLGGQPTHFPSAQEFNLMQDVPASQVMFDSGVPLVLIPCMQVASHLTVTAEEMNARLRGQSEVGTYLAEMVTSHFVDEAISDGRMMKKFYLGGLDDIPDEVAAQYQTTRTSFSRIIWDISTVGYVMNPNWCATHLVPAPILHDDMSWGQDATRHPIRYCSYVCRDPIFGDMFAKLAD